MSEIEVQVDPSYWQEWTESETEARKRRALEDPIYLIDTQCRDKVALFRILGTSGRSYTVDAFTSQRSHQGSSQGSSPTPQWSCTCRDFVMRRRPCKHVHFVWFRVLNIEASTLTNHESPFFDSIQAIHARVNQRASLPASPVVAATSPSTLATPNTPPSLARREWHGENCPICYETMSTSGPETWYCHEGCGNSVHAHCYQACVQFTKQLKCPYCRVHMHPAGLIVQEKKKRKQRIRY